MNKLTNNILDLFFPKTCVGCQKIGSYFCPECINNITQSELVCPFCERPSLGGVTHPVCQRRYGLDGLWFLGTYQDPLRKAIHKLKYKFITEMAEELVNLTLNYWAHYQPFLLDQIKKDRGRGWLVVSVPLHWQKQNWRGFNQSSKLAKLLAQKIGLNYQEVLIRAKNTKSQAKLLSYDRKQNVKNAFALSSTIHHLPSNVLLIDDVWTTGSTLKECCYILKKAGVKKVWALTIAR